MNLEILNSILVLGIILMVIGSIRTGRSTAKLRATNERRRRRMEAAYERCE